MTLASIGLRDGVQILAVRPLPIAIIYLRSFRGCMTDGYFVYGVLSTRWLGGSLQLFSLIRFLCFSICGSVS